MHPPHMSSQEFREAGRRAIDWIADYWERVEGLPVHSKAAPGEIAAMLPGHAPEQGGEGVWEEIFADLDRVVLPGVTHWQHPSFFAYFPANTSAPGVLGELLSAGLGVNGMLWATSPVATELETRVLDWMAEACGVPARFRSTALDASGRPAGGGVIQGTASESTLVAILAARARARAAGGAVAEPVVYCSSQAHSSVVKGAMIAGIASGPDDHEHARRVGVDGRMAMRPDELESWIERDRAQGRTPLMVCATAGTTSSMAFDDLRAVGALARRHGLWMHADAAMAGCAAICPEHRAMFDGIELADSLCFNPHKWLLTTFDCDLFFTADRASVLAALSIAPAYLRTSAADAGAIDYRDWQIPLGRRFRALKLWLVLRHYGLENLRAFIRASCAHAELAEALLRADARLEIVAPRALTLVCFRPRPAPGQSPAEADARTQRLLDALNASGRVLLTPTELPGVQGGPARRVIRLSTGGAFTQERHVRAAADLIRAHLNRLDP
ncbi:MAG: aspartate aminotransferase family protein [Phycisphaeraceae bacterium]|nr:aspartate aminotransferase family protein [Phycisphaeraceae bacterium]